MDTAAAALPLEAEHEALLQFLYVCPVGVAQLDGHGTVDMMNPLAIQLLMPVAPMGVVENLFDALAGIEPDLRHRAESFTEERGAICENHRIQLSNGSVRRGQRTDPLVVALTLLRIEPDRIMAVLVDVSKQVAQERLVRQHEAWLAAIFNGVKDFAIYSLSCAGEIETWNATGERLFGLPASEVVGRGIDVLHDQREPSWNPALEAARHDGWYLREGWCSRGDGERFWSNTLISAMKLEEGEISGFCVVTRDTNERKQSLDELRRLTTTDQLTGTLNRYAFFERAAAEEMRCRRHGEWMSAIMIDADHFKRVNDVHGHAVGDRVLKSLATVCQGELRGNDVIARLGGEEFAVLLPSTDPAQALRVAERLRAQIEALEIPLPGNEVPLRITASLGIAATGGGAEEVRKVEELLEMADQALYRAKHGGRNRVEAHRLEPAAL
ncbi:MAG: sensor domain-containing diguanylate cyclase [Alphaproteobacteria bacterium]|nr:sensor domain-containing diguanylate cyclase [Alphaproteobacteria bacterium]